MIAKNFNGYIVIIVVMNFHKKFQSQNFSIQVSCHFRKYFPAQNNSSLQYLSVGNSQIILREFIFNVLYEVRPQKL